MVVRLIRSRIRAMMMLALVLSLGVLAVPPAQAGTITYRQDYEASSAYVYGNPPNNYAFFGTIFCSGGDLFDTGGCIPYQGSWGDARGKPFSVTLDDDVYGTNAWYIVAFDMNNDRALACGQAGNDVCFLGKGTISGTVPTGADGGILRVFPATVKTTSFGCCIPQSAALTGDITVRYTI